jgi:hypothetical protein
MRDNDSLRRTLESLAAEVGERPDAERAVLSRARSRRRFTLGVASLSCLLVVGGISLAASSLVKGQGTGLPITSSEEETTFARYFFRANGAGMDAHGVLEVDADPGSICYEGTTSGVAASHLVGLPDENSEFPHLAPVLATFFEPGSENGASEPPGSGAICLRNEEMGEMEAQLQTLIDEPHLFKIDFHGPDETTPTLEAELVPQGSEPQEVERTGSPCAEIVGTTNDDVLIKEHEAELERGDCPEGQFLAPPSPQPTGQTIRLCAVLHRPDGTPIAPSAGEQGECAEGQTELTAEVDNEGSSRYAPPRFRPLKGWLTSRWAAEEGGSPQAWASTRDFGNRITYEKLPEMREDDIAIHVQLVTPSDYVNYPLRHFPERKLPLRLGDAEIQESFSMQWDKDIPARYLSAYTRGHRLMVWIYFGTPDPTPEMLGQAQAQLERLKLPPAW